MVYNVHEQVMPESCHYLTTLHALSHPCLVSLLFIPSLYSTFFNSKNFFYLYIMHTHAYDRMLMRGYLPPGLTYPRTRGIDS